MVEGNLHLTLSSILLASWIDCLLQIMTNTAMLYEIHSLQYHLCVDTPPAVGLTAKLDSTANEYLKSFPSAQKIFLAFPFKPLPPSVTPRPA